VAGDVMVQEYGRYHGLPTCCLDDSAVLPTGVSAEGIGVRFSTQPPVSLYS
jgi:hypothetical protein